MQLKFCPKPCQYLIVDLHKFREKEFAWFSSCGTSEVLLIVVVLLLALGTLHQKSGGYSPIFSYDTDGYNQFSF